MIITRSDNPDQSNIKSKSNIKKAKISLDVPTLTILCKYSISTSSYLRLSHLINLKNLLDIIDPDTYQNNPDKLKRIQFIKRALEAKIDYNLKDLDMILIHINSKLDFDVDFIDESNCELDKDQITWVNNLVNETLQYKFIYEDSAQMLDLLTRIQSSDYSHRGDLIKEYKNMIDVTTNKFRLSKSDDSITDMSFTLKEGEFENIITETYNIITNPSRRLLTGMQAFNEITGGGFESGRVYMLLGITGVGKSLTLLNLAYQIKKYNTNYKTKDPTKIPCVVILTMENTVVETITRLYDLAVTNSQGMVNYSLQDVIYNLRTQGELVLNENSPIDIVIKYKANKSINTNYLYSLYDDLVDEGYEPICIIQDHVKRIRSIFGTSDIRLELGDIVNEFKVFAAEKDIPVITNSHLNRDAARTIEEGEAKSSKVDITTKLGKSNAGESLLMMDNIDCAIIINHEWDEDNNKYMVFKTIKMRDKVDRTYFAQPFVYGSSIKLVEDMNGRPMFRESLRSNADINKMANMKTTSTNALMSNNTSIAIDSMNAVNTFGVAPNYILEEQDYAENDEISLVMPKVRKPIKFINKPKANEMLKLEELKNDISKIAL